jgi:hypothetical protein
LPTATTTTTLPNTTTTTTLPADTTTTTIGNIGTIPQPEKPIADMTGDEIKSFTISLQEYLLSLLKRFMDMLTNKLGVNRNININQVVEDDTATTTTKENDEEEINVTTTTTTTIPVTVYSNQTSGTSSVDLITNLGPAPEPPKTFSISTQTEVKNYLDSF